MSKFIMVKVLDTLQLSLKYLNESMETRDIRYYNISSKEDKELVKSLSVAVFKSSVNAFLSLQDTYRVDERI